MACVSKRDVEASLKPWRVDLDWAGETAVCIGGGPSLTPGQVERVRGRAQVIGINDAYKVAPWASVLYGCDLKWWEWHRERVFEQFTGVMVTTDKIAHCRWQQIRYLPGKDAPGLSWDPGLIHWGRNSGYQALNLAVLTGASRVLLLGYDHKMADNGRAHWFGDHPDRVRSSYESWIKDNWSTVPEALRGHDVEVINCTPGSAIAVFPHADLEEVLDD